MSFSSADFNRFRAASRGWYFGAYFIQIVVFSNPNTPKNNILRRNGKKTPGRKLREKNVDGEYDTAGFPFKEGGRILALIWKYVLNVLFRGIIAVAGKNLIIAGS